MDRSPAGEAPSTPTDARMVRTRAALCDALLRLIEEKPFEQVTVREITRTAEVGYATFFRHYPDKEALLNDLAAGQIGELLQHTVPVLFATDSRAAAQVLCSYVEEHHKLWAALLIGGASAVMRQEIIRQCRELAVGQPNPDTWLPGDLRIVYAAGGAIDVLAWWLEQRPRPPVERIAEILDRLVIAPTLADADFSPR
jgi:AcrR family transcriptional regulator